MVGEVGDTQDEKSDVKLVIVVMPLGYRELVFA